ncbi:MAG: toprim domain-containing protein, partial [Cyclobacteriaceae bacterium]
NGVGPSDLQIDSLVTRVSAPDSQIKEIILALSPTMEGDTTSFYINRKLSAMPLKITSIARGVPVGGDLEYADEITLGRSILGRTLFN